MALDPEEREPWLSLKEPVSGHVSAKQENAIRDYARSQGFKDLRGFHMRLRMMGWDFYDVLNEWDT